METPGRIAVSPHALDFTVENVEKVNFMVFTAIPEDHGLIRLCKRMKRWEYFAVEREMGWTLSYGCYSSFIQFRAPEYLYDTL